MTSIPPIVSNSPFPIGNTGVPNLTQIMDTLQHIVLAINNLQQTVSKIFPLGLTSSATWTPGGITSGTQVTKTVTCAGAVLGMSAQAAFSLDIQATILTAYVNSSNSVTVVLANLTGSTVTLGAGIISVWVRQN